MTYMERLKHYSCLTGISVEDIISEALEDWFETVGAALIEAAPENVVEFRRKG